MKFYIWQNHNTFSPGFPISTHSKLTSNIIVIETDDIRLPSDCQPDLNPSDNLNHHRNFSSDTPKHLLSNPKVDLHPQNENTFPIFFIRLPLPFVWQRQRHPGIVASLGAGNVPSPVQGLPANGQRCGRFPTAAWLPRSPRSG
jgi:hypothetical protein